MNTFIFEGRLTKDCEIKYTPSGMMVCTFSVVDSKKIKDKERVNYFEFSMFGKYAEAMNSYLTKGQQVVIFSEAQQNRWTDKTTGQNRSKIVFIVKELKLVGGKKESGAPANFINKEAPIC